VKKMDGGGVKVASHLSLLGTGGKLRENLLIIGSGGKEILGRVRATKRILVLAETCVQ